MATAAAAEAHAGHGAEPVGGRGLDKPNVIDIVTQDGYYLALGDLAVAPGSYCGVSVTLGRLNGEAYGKLAKGILVLDTPHFVKTAPDGRFRLEGLPAGRFVLKAWLDEKTVLERPVELKDGDTLRVEFPPRK